MPSWWEPNCEVVLFVAAAGEFEPRAKAAVGERLKSLEVDGLREEHTHLSGCLKLAPHFKNT